MPAMWKGVIGFGLVSIPVSLAPAIEEHDVTLGQVHREDAGRVRLRRWCDRCGQDVDYDQVARGYRDPAGHEVTLTEADMDDLPLPTKKLIDVLAFVDASTIDPVRLSRPYFLAPESPAAAKPYVLLRDVLAASGQAAVTKITLATRESLALLRVRGDTLAVQTMYWPDEVRSAEGIAPPADVTVHPSEIEMAVALMNRMSQGFDLAALRDEYQHALDSMVDAKLQGTLAPHAEAVAPVSGDITDLMAALQASINARGQAELEKKPVPRKTAAKKTTAKKTTKRRPA